MYSEGGVETARESQTDSQRAKKIRSFGRGLGAAVPGLGMSAWI